MYSSFQEVDGVFKFATANNSKDLEEIQKFLDDAINDRYVVFQKSSSFTCIRAIEYIVVLWKPIFCSFYVLKVVLYVLYIKPKTSLNKFTLYLFVFSRLCSLILG